MKTAREATAVRAAATAESRPPCSMLQCHSGLFDTFKTRIKLHFLLLNASWVPSDDLQDMK